MTAVVSDVVWAVSVCDPVDGLVTPSSWTVTWDPAAMLSPPKRPQVAVRPDWLQEPTLGPPALRTELLSTILRFVPVGKVIVIWLSAAADRAPVPDVSNWIE